MKKERSFLGSHLRACLMAICLLFATAVSAQNVTVKGTVSEVQQVTSTGATFMLGDLKCYRLKGLENKDIVNTEFLKANDVVVVYGSLQKYIDKNNNNAIVPEVSSGYVYSVNGKTQDDSENPEDAITTGKNADSPMTAQQALAYISEFPDGFITSNQYYVSGTVSEVTEINTEKGNATFKIGDLVVRRELLSSR